MEPKNDLQSQCNEEIVHDITNILLESLIESEDSKKAIGLISLFPNVSSRKNINNLFKLLIFKENNRDFKSLHSQGVNPNNSTKKKIFDLSLKKRWWEIAVFYQPDLIETPVLNKFMKLVITYGPKQAKDLYAKYESRLDQEIKLFYAGKLLSSQDYTLAWDVYYKAGLLSETIVETIVETIISKEENFAESHRFAEHEIYIVSLCCEGQYKQSWLRLAELLLKHYKFTKNDLREKGVSQKIAMMN